MSPLISKEEQQRSNSVNRQRRRHLDMEPLYCSDDENRPTGTEYIQIQSSETSLPLESHCRAALTSSTTHRKQQRSSVVKLSKENRGGRAEQPFSKTCSGKFANNAFTTPSRPDTPTTVTATTTTSSRFRRSTNMSATAAAKLLQSSGMSQPSLPLNSSDDTNHNLRSNTTARSLPDFLSSMPEAEAEAEADMTLPTRLLAEKNFTRGGSASSDSFKFSASPCSRSLNLPPNYSLPKPYTNSVKPPVPPCAKLLGTDTNTRKGKKVFTHQENVHSLRLLHNRYLQWRFANAKAEASMQAQQRECQRTLHSLGVKISELFDSVKRKRIKLGLLQRTKTLSTVLEAQIPYLEEWSVVEEEYSVSLSEAIQALLNASLQLPIVNVRADIREVGEALNSAIKVMEIMVFHLQSFMPKAEETENLISELARVIGGERALIGECGDLLSKTYTSQVEEFSLRGQLIQLNNCSHKNNLVNNE